MKKITTAAVFTLLLLQTKAQTVSINYIKEFVSDSKSYMTDKNFAPYEVSGIVVAYSQALKKIPLAVNISAARKPRKPPPWIIKYPDPYVIGKYAIDNKIDADSANLASSKSYSTDVLVGVGYIIPHKEYSKFIVTVNADFGAAFNNNQAVNYYLQGKLTGKAEVQKTQFIINPNIQAKYFFSKNVGLNFTAGYNNRGGVNVGGGVVLNVSKTKETGNAKTHPHIISTYRCKCGRIHG
jgi:hypothetical protein